MRTDVNVRNCTQGCMDTVRESAMKVDSGRKIPCRTRESNLCWQRASPMLHPLNYIPTQYTVLAVQFFTLNILADTSTAMCFHLQVLNERGWQPMRSDSRNVFYIQSTRSNVCGNENPDETTLELFQSLDSVTLLPEHNTALLNQQTTADQTNFHTANTESKCFHFKTIVYFNKKKF